MALNDQEAGFGVCYEVDCGFGDVVEHLLGQAGEDADPEDVVHDVIGVSHLADYAVLPPFVGGLAEEVAGEEKAGADLVGFERLG